ncbi:MAG TPA: XdhC family protein [Gemmatimonadaceae bacterium]|nr:XdhC family protein [Gemmatimonadaceae bacterium]
MAQDLIDFENEAVRRERSLVLATLVAASGSASKKIGAKMLVGESGRLIGGVTIGGCIDAQVIEAADALIARGGRDLLTIALDDDEAWEIGLTCGGAVEVLLERVQPNDDGDAVVAAHRAAAALVARGESAAIVTPIEPAGAPVALAESALAGWNAEGRVFIDRIAPPTTLVIVGAGQIAMSLATFARELELRAVIVDGRERYATRERFPDASEIRIGMPSELVSAMPLGARDAVVLVAHDYKYDLPVLRHVLRSRVGYVGMLGSKRRGGAVRDILREEGFTDAELARLHSPIGLDLGGRSAAEVALSIVAELVAVLHAKRA